MPLVAEPFGLQHDPVADIAGRVAVHADLVDADVRDAVRVQAGCEVVLEGVAVGAAEDDALDLRPRVPGPEPLIRLIERHGRDVVLALRGQRQFPQRE